jgi:type II secretory pathway pseudopilin PulG
VNHSRCERGDGGFSLIEQIIAMVVIVGVLLGLLSTLGATARGVTTGRQRTIAVSLSKQVIENLQGAAYSDVAMDQSTLTADALVLGVMPNLTFEGEQLVLGGPTAAPYRTLTVAVGTTFSLRTFVTGVASGGAGYRRTTVIVDWPSVSPTHTLRFSSLVFPLDYTSYPASSGSAEATGGLITVSGQLGGDTFEDVHMVLPGIRAETSSSTLRTAIGAAASAASNVDLITGPVTSIICSAVGDDLGECPRQTLESVADNDSTSTTGSWVKGVGQPFAAGSLSTPGGATMVTPAGTMTTRASTDACGTCGFGDNDGFPWVDASVATTTSSSAAFTTDYAEGALSGSLWTLANVWSPTASVDHDPTGGGIVTASAQLSAPAISVLKLTGAPAGFDGAVKVGAFTAKASAQSGYTLVAPDVVTGTTTVQIQLWDGVAYRTVNMLAGAALDTTATATFTIGTHVVVFNTHVLAQPSTFSTVATAPRTDAAAQHPSMFVIVVEVTITTTPPAPSTTSPEATSTTVDTTTSTTEASTSTTVDTTPPTSSTTSTTSTSSTTTTIAPLPVVVDTFTIVVDYGRVSAHSTWLAKAA